MIIVKVNSLVYLYIIKKVKAVNTYIYIYIVRFPIVSSMGNLTIYKLPYLYFMKVNFQWLATMGGYIGPLQLKTKGLYISPLSWPLEKWKSKGPFTTQISYGATQCKFI